MPRSSWRQKHPDRLLDYNALKRIEEDALLPGYAFIYDCPNQAIRTNITTLEGLTQAISRGIKSIEEVVTYANHSAITDATIRHLFRGDGGGGRHHITAILNDNIRRLIDRKSETANGYYGAVFSTGSKKSFWPDTWDEFDVVDDIKYVLNNDPELYQQLSYGAIYRGQAQNGQLIEYLMHNDGHMVTAYPILTDFP